MNRTLIIYLFTVGLPLIFGFNTVSAQSQDLVEVTGTVVMEHSSTPLSGMVISVQGTDRGVVTNEAGMFSIVMKRGEKGIIEGGGFKANSFQVPRDYQGTYYAVVLPMRIDTIQLENFTYRLMTPREFDFAFKYGYVPDELLATSRANMSAENRASALMFMPRDGNELQSMQQMQNYLRHGSDYGQPSGTRLGSPAAWRDFIQSWKRGDFKGRNQ